MTGVEPRTSGMKKTALPTEPQPLWRAEKRIAETLKRVFLFNLRCLEFRVKITNLEN